MQKDSLEDSSFFQLQSDKIILNFQEITTSNTEITSNRVYTQTVLFENYILFFGEKLCTQTNILAFDLELMKWTTIPVDAKQSKAFIEGSECRLCYYSSPSPLIFFRGIHKMAYNSQSFLEALELKKLNDKEKNDSGNKLPFEVKWKNFPEANLPFRHFQTSNFIEARMYLEE